MAINITKEMIEAVCPSAMMPDDRLIRELGIYFIEAQASLYRLVTKPIMQSIANCIDLDTPAVSPNEEIWQWCLRYIIAKAYYEAIPHLDLVLTPTGFGVVSNQNVAPASADRVERLREQMKHQWMLYYEEVLSLLRNFKDWHTSGAAKAHASLFWRSKFLVKLGIINPTLEDLYAKRPEIANGAYMLSHLISGPFYRELLEAEMHADTIPIQDMAIDLCRNFIAAAVTGKDSIILHRNILLQFLDENINSFPTYRVSSAYEANHFKHYENEKDDPCYFFG